MSDIFNEKIKQEEASRQYDPSEQDEIIAIFADMLRDATKDGGVKRAAGVKPSWKVDPDHRRGFWSHVAKWKHGDRVDPDSGAHPMVHAAWRALAIAWQEQHAQGETPTGTPGNVRATLVDPK